LAYKKTLCYSKGLFNIQWTIPKEDFEGIFSNLGGHRRWLNQSSSMKEKNYF
jgi:hypothetical protein